MLTHLAALFLILATPSTELTSNKIVIPLGVARVTKYTHNEGGRCTASGYLLKDSDKGKVCAISRDWWKKRVLVGDVIHIGKMTCRAVDTMALRNSKGLKQKKWVDVYNGSEVAEALDFGIQKFNVWIER